MATLMMRDAIAARWSAALTRREIHQPFSASVDAMPSVKTAPSTAAKAAPAPAEKTSAWLTVSNETAKAAPTAAITAGWLARARRSGSQWLFAPTSATGWPGGGRRPATRFATPPTLRTPMGIQALPTPRTITHPGEPPGPPLREPSRRPRVRGGDRYRAADQRDDQAVAKGEEQ